MLGSQYANTRWYLKLNTARTTRSIYSVKSAPDKHAEASSELLFGELMQVLEQDAQWCKIRSVRDNYEGFVETAVCDFTPSVSSHWVSTRATFVFEKPDIKSTVVQRLLFGSELTLCDEGTNTNFLKLRNSGFIWAAHCLEKKSSLNSSLTQIAQNYYLHAPYLWGGRSTDGCDCSGMVQMAAMAKGIYLPRDSVDQEVALVSSVEYESRTADDLVFWPGHVGILLSPELLIHATAHTMRCCIEPLQDVTRRAGVPSSVKRIDQM